MNIFAKHSINSVCEQEDNVDDFLPTVWSLQNPDNPLDAIHGDALLETA